MREIGSFFPQRPWKRAALWLCFLGPFFFITYGLANAHTASLPRVGSFVFSWEHRIPFIPWTIIPYWSIDLLYGLSLFVWSTRRELDRHALRLATATLVCVGAFLLFPLQFSFTRPDIPQAPFRFLFRLLESFDQPYNQAPSLHICLLIIIWDALRRHTSSSIRPLVHVWAALIAVSVFTTYQHHVIDGLLAVPTGLLCCYLIPLEGGFPLAPLGKFRPAWTPGDGKRARRLGARYAGLACGCALGAGLGWHVHSAWWGLLGWPALCLVLVAGGYFGLGPGIFQKTPGTGPHAGTRHFAARILLAPYEYGARAYRRAYTRALPPAAEVAPGLWIGAYPRALPTPGCAVLDLTSEYARPSAGAGKGARYAAVPLLDLLPPNARELEEALDHLERLRQQGPVLVHCALGMTRSALVLACFLARSGLCAHVREAFARIEDARPCIVVSESAVAVAERFVAGKGAAHV